MQRAQIQDVRRSNPETTGHLQHDMPRILAMPVTECTQQHQRCGAQTHRHDVAATVPAEARSEHQRSKQNDHAYDQSLGLMRPQQELSEAVPIVVDRAQGHLHTGQHAEHDRQRRAMNGAREGHTGAQSIPTHKSAVGLLLHGDTEHIWSAIA